MVKTKTTKLSGFTLIELLIVIAIMAILMAVIFVALNPLARFQDARNSKRWTDVNALLSAVKLNQVDHQGSYIATITALTNNTPYMIGTCAGVPTTTCTGLTLASGCVDLSLLVTQGNLASIPNDPNTATGSTETGYYLIKSDTGSITVGACSEEAGSAGTAPDIYSKR